MHQQVSLRSLLVSSQVDTQVNYLSQDVQLQLGLPSLENVALMISKNYDYYCQQKHYLVTESISWI